MPAGSTANPDHARQLEALRKRIESIPSKKMDENLLLATWNIRNFGPDKPQDAIEYMAEICKRFDIIAIQEVRDSLGGLQRLQSQLGPDYSVVLTDTAGNYERLVFLYDNRRVKFTGLAGEIVLEPWERDNPRVQFNRTPYMVSFRCSSADFVLVTAHIFYSDENVREYEIKQLVQFLKDRAEDQDVYDPDIFALGDFNIVTTKDEFFEALVSKGMIVEKKIRDLKTNFSHNKHYDQIAYFDYPDTLIEFSDAGVVDFTDILYTGLDYHDKVERMSDHLPLWAEFRLKQYQVDLDQVLNP